MNTAQQRFDRTYEGYDAAYDSKARSTNPYHPSSEEWELWDRGYENALVEMEQDNAIAIADRDDDYNSGRWTEEDERSMNAGRDLPMRNEAGEWMV